MKPKLYYLASSIIKSHILHLAIIFVITDWSVVAQTQIQSGNICGVWKKSGSPYLINGHITVLDDSVLTIEPGVVVEFQGHYKLVVYGQILAVGTKFDSITFTVKNKTEGWKGIRFDNSDYGAAGAMKDNHLSKLYYCKIQYGNATDEVPDYRGGAIYIYNFAQLVISNCNISYNKAKYGGGIAVYSTRGRVQIVKNIISYNTAEYDGGGVFISGSEGYLTDNLIYKNTSNYGGGIQCIAANPFITNTTVCNNTATQGGGMDCFRSSPIVRNSLFWGNTAKLGAQVYLYDEDADPDFYYCNIQGGRDAFGRHYATYTGIYDTCLDADPLFNDTLNGDYSFRSGSPCIDKGDPNYEPGTKALDIRGNPRIDQIIDLGAIEYINNYPPTDIQLSKNSVNEKLPVGTIIGLFTATDKDVGDSHIFTFATGNGVNDADNDRFTISNNQLLTDTLFSLPADSVFNINIRVNDSRGGWYNEAFQITVKNINATPSNIILSANTLSESRSVGSMVGILSVVDSDPSDLHTYKLINSAGNSFIIDGNRVVTNKQFNYALQNTYTIEVEVNDGNSGIFKKQFVIKITEQSIYFSLDSTWEWRNPMPFVGGLYTIIQQSTNRLIAGGEYGIMLNSDTSGLFWDQSDNLSNLTLKINDIAFFDNTNQKGYAINSSGLLATNDGGLTWSSDNSVAQLVSLTGTLDYKAVSFYQDKLYVLVNDAQKSYLFSKTSTGNWTVVQVPKGDLLLGMEYPFLWSKEIVYNGTKSVLTLDTSYDLKQVIAAGTPSDFLFLAKNQGFTYKLYKNSLTNDLGEIALSENGDLAYDVGFKPANTILKFINTDTILALGDEVYLFTDTCSKFEILTKNGVDGDASNKTIATDAVKLAHNFFITATDGKVYKLTGTKAQSLIKQSNSNVSYIQGLYFNNVAVGYLIQSHTPDRELWY